MRILKKIVLDKASGNICLLDQYDRVYHYRRDEKISCDAETLVIVCQVLEAIGVKMVGDQHVGDQNLSLVLERDMGSKCGGCGEEMRSVAVTLNENEGLDGLGRFFLDEHPAYSTQKGFCSDECFVEFLRKHPEEALACVPPYDARHEYDRNCYNCAKKGIEFISVKGEYDSVLDDINYPHYFCSVACIIDAVEHGGAPEAYRQKGEND